MKPSNPHHAVINTLFAAMLSLPGAQCTSPPPIIPQGTALEDRLPARPSESKFPLFATHYLPTLTAQNHAAPRLALLGPGEFILPDEVMQTYHKTVFRFSNPLRPGELSRIGAYTGRKPPARSATQKGYFTSAITALGYSKEMTDEFWAILHTPNTVALSADLLTRTSPIYFTHTLHHERLHRTLESLFNTERVFLDTAFPELVTTLNPHHPNTLNRLQMLHGIPEAEKSFFLQTKLQPQEFYVNLAQDVFAPFTQRILDKMQSRYPQAYLIFQTFVHQTPRPPGIETRMDAHKK